MIPFWIIYVNDIPFWYSEEECMYTEVLWTPTRNIFLAISMDFEFLLHYRNTELHTFTESRRSSHSYINNSSSSTTTHMQLPPFNPNVPLHQTYYKIKTDPQAEHVNLIKTAL